MNAHTFPGSKDNKAARPAAIDADGPGLSTTPYTVTITADGDMFITPSLPTPWTVAPGDTFAVCNDYEGGSAIIWDNGSASVIVSSGSPSSQITCGVGHTYDIMIMTNDYTPTFSSEKINVGSGEGTPPSRTTR